MIDLEVVLLFCLLASERKPTFLVDPLDCLLVLQILRIQYNQSFACGQATIQSFGMRWCQSRSRMHSVQLFFVLKMHSVQQKAVHSLRSRLFRASENASRTVGSLF